MEKINQFRDLVVVVEGRNDADALCSRGIDQPFFIALDQKMRVLNDSLKVTFAVMKNQNHIRRAIILTDFDRDGEKHHARIKSEIIDLIEVEDSLRYELKTLIHSDEIEMIRNYSSSRKSKVFYQLSNLPPRKYLLLSALSGEGQKTVGEVSSILEKMGVKIQKDKIRTDLRNLQRDGFASYDSITSRFAISGSGLAKISRLLLEIRSRKIGTRL